MPVTWLPKRCSAKAHCTLRLLPQTKTYRDAAPDTDPFFIAMQIGVKLNRKAEGFAAASAFSAGLATLASFK